ncbi:hypothetical protein N5A93_14915 [Roseovarius sp. EGI FJ00037]|uniref:hypothetical protein n=1 Tax=Roseovarius salincola TaxID=2978479 RepID=UPI0022A87B65|nr:hypothetical protein [Roseovarius sp. EGI FJ00037]MCZ0813527.1 hypothetical protein [Roseovarius sp. EGI FJ00037]
MTQTDQTDQVFAEDPASIPLKEREQTLLGHLREITGEDLRPALMPPDPPQSWPLKAHDVLRRYWEVSRELSRLNSRRESQRLSRFLQAVTGETEMSDATGRWWLNRY